ncbi:hypothetical protein [Streptomyces asoensis]|uniref:hypothetical protein n=1 Tax=Streptomyces asoensis TaxID=249586 RepID=UPI00167902FB|nr:hypothetical protein [Streptomyces asoensis]
MRNVFGQAEFTHRAGAGEYRDVKSCAGAADSGREKEKRGGSRGSDQAAAQQEALETRARSTWRRRVRSSRIFMSSIVAAARDGSQGKPDRSRIADH